MFGGSTMTMEGTPGATWLDERNRRKAAEADEVARVFDAVEARRLDAELTRAFVANGVGRVEPIGTEDRTRVGEIIAHERLERETERRRGLAEVQASNGDFTNFADTVLPPTAEWLAKHETRTFTPRQPDGTVRVIRTVRRVNNTIIHKMHTSGNLTDDQFEACRWYTERHAAASLDGRYKSSNISFTSGTSGGCGDGQTPMALYLHEAQARVEFRAAREKIPAFYLKFFEAIVLGDIPMRRAVRFARCRTEKGPVRFRECCGVLAAHLAAVKAKMVSEADAD